MKPRYIGLISTFLLVLGLLLAYVSSQHTPLAEVGHVTLPLVFGEQSSLRGGAGKTTWKYYVDAPVYLKPPPRGPVSLGGNFDLKLGFHLQKVTVERGDGPTKNVSDMDAYADAEFWERMSATLITNKAKVTPDGAEKLVSGLEDGKKVWSASWNIEPQMPGKENMKVLINAPGVDLEFSNPIAFDVTIRSGWHAIAESWWAKVASLVAVVSGALGILTSLRNLKQPRNKVARPAS